MKWKKLGVILRPGRLSWMVSHVQNPFAEERAADTFRIHFAGRDQYSRARGGWIEININAPTRVVAVSKNPSLDIGAMGCFDDCGAMPSCIVSREDNHYMYYTGWSQSVVTPFTFFIGLAVSTDGGKTFERFSQAPIIGRTAADPFLTASPWVLRENGLWRMWYVSGTGWECSAHDTRPKHYYHIRYAESRDGIVWKTDGTVCIDYRDAEYAIARPVVYKGEGIYKMWYCYRGGHDTYRAGYAESPDGIRWTRKDEEAGIDVSEEGWDSEMICYPFVFAWKDKEYMLYNGNNFGRTGCGIAVREE